MDRFCFSPFLSNSTYSFFLSHDIVSESLQYPDFTVVAIYRKIIVGFALIVPHENQIEAYISFLFTHPEWRRAGIAKFMLYHLVQSCLGKDITVRIRQLCYATQIGQKSNRLDLFDTGPFDQGGPIL